MTTPATTPKQPQLPTILEEEKKAETFAVIRDSILLGVSLDFINSNGFSFDSDIYKIIPSEGFRPVKNNKRRFISDGNFLLSSSTVGSDKIDEGTVGALEKYFSDNAKLPSFLEFRLVDNKVGIFALQNIANETYLGNFEGMFRPDVHTGTTFGRKVYGFQNEEIGIISADNILFSNWTRYLIPTNTEKENCIFIPHNFSLRLFTMKEIKVGERLMVVN